MDTSSSILNLWDKDNNNLYYLSVYRTVDNWSENIIKSELQNQIKDALQGCEVALSGNQINNIAGRIIDQIISQQFHKSSVAIFCALNLSNPDNVEIKFGENLIVIFSDEKISSAQCCGEIFCLMNLYKMTQYSADCLCIYVSRKSTSFYLLNSEIELISKNENIILEAYEDRFRNPTPGTNGSIHSGSSSDNKEMKFAKKILNDMLTKLKSIAVKQNQYKCIFIVYTDDFANYADFIDKELTYFSEMKPVQHVKGIDIDSQFEREFKNLRQEAFTNLTKEKLEKYTTSIDNTFSTDTEEITKASREGRIQKLYVKEGHTQKGFIHNRDMPYLGKYENSVSTDFLLDWIIKKVIDTNGEIFTLNADSNFIDGAMAAKFRY